MKLPQSFWEEVVYTKSMDGKTPIKAWSGIRPSAK